MIKIQMPEEEKRATAHDVYSKLVASVKIFQQGLEQYDDEQFVHKQTDTTWSLGQMYEHVSGSANYYFMANVLRCLEKRKGQIGGSKNQAGDNIFFYGGFPPKKFEMPNPDNIEIIAKPIAEYKAILEKILIDAEKLIEPITNDDGRYKCEQFTFAWLNAFEWYSMLEMHTRHHLRQKKELEGYVGIKA